MLRWGCHVVEIGWPSCSSRLRCISTTVVHPMMYLKTRGAPECVKKDKGGKLEALSSTSLLFWGA
eukprot:9480236-Ditylum_brightwellii.AAC.1